MLQSGKAKAAIIAAASVAITCAWLVYRAMLPDPVGDPSHELFPIRGIDVSSHNGDIDFNAVKKAGYSFVLIKASEGTDFKDSRFIDNIRRARRAGLKVGAYHFFRFDADGIAQGINFLHSLRGRSIDLPAAIDIEEWANPDTEHDDTVAMRLQRLITHIESRGLTVMLYTNKDGYQRFVHKSLSQYPLWLCSFSQLDGKQRWNIWQYTHSGRVDGINGPVDINVFNGDSLQWLQWCIRNAAIMQ